MFVKVHKPVNTPCVCDNKDRCRALVEYLLKESLEDKPYYDTFFSHEEDYVPPVTVIQKIDNNHKKLMKGDDKFYMLSINPSQDEAAHLIRKVTGKQVTEFEQLTVEEQEKVIHELKNYSRNCMDTFLVQSACRQMSFPVSLLYSSTFPSVSCSQTVVCPLR